MKRFFTTLGKQSAILAVSLLLAFSPFTSLLTVAQAQVGAETSASQVSPAVAKPSNPSGGVSSAKRYWLQYLEFGIQHRRHFCIVSY
jgi:hypothetical protein